MDYNIILGKSVLTNSVDVFSGTLNISYTSYTDGGVYLCKVPITNTTVTPTLNLNGIGAKNIEGISINGLLIDVWYMFMYNLSLDKFIVINTNTFAITTTPSIQGGAGTSSSITYKSTTGTGTATGIAHSFIGGTNGSKNIITFLNNGKIGISNNAPAYPLSMSAGITGFTTTYGTYTNSQIASDVTDAAWLYITTPTTQATVFTLGSLVHYGASAVTVGAGSTVTNNIGFFASSGMNRGTNNRGFQGSLIAAANAYNLYMDGDANNYLGGNVGIFVLSPTAKLHLGAGTATANTAPLQFESGAVEVVPRAGVVEFTTDNYYLTSTTSTVRKTVRDLVVRNITALRTLDGSDELVNITSGTFSVTLPTAVGYTKQYTVKNSGTGHITIATTSSQTIDDQVSGYWVLAGSSYSSMTLRSDGANWIIV